MERLLKMAASFAYFAGAVENGYFCENRKKRVSPNYRNVVPKPAHQRERTFMVKGVEISAYSRKDAIKRYTHRFGKSK